MDFYSDIQSCNLSVSRLKDCHAAALQIFNYRSSLELNVIYLELAYYVLQLNHP